MTVLCFKEKEITQYSASAKRCAAAPLCSALARNSSRAGDCTPNVWNDRALFYYLLSC
jgi:hypothetical protein